ncbi:MAG: prolyl oligopeptidase family serine peptidase [Clostridiales bacterium]|nr:prolyl oligopeptidase family serine peptidase [Clostridiales bacterium]
MKRNTIRKTCIFVLAVSFLTAGLFAGCGSLTGGKSASKNTTAKDTKGRMEVRGFDWGPAVVKVTLDVPDSPLSSDLTSESVTVTEEKADASDFYSEPRIVTAVYYSDADGNRIESAGDVYLSIELQIGPEEGLLTYYDNKTCLDNWYKDYRLIVKMPDGSELAVAGDRVFPEIENASIENVFTGREGHSFRCISYEPGNASAENLRPLVIWFHGGGSGGTDPVLAMYGNRITAFLSDEFQSVMDGAYVLVPVCPTFWSQYDEEGHWNDNVGQDSIYLHDVKELIDSFVASHHVDPDRILIGGCSNGGYMVMDMLLNYPDFFSAAVPICELYEPEAVTDARISVLKDIPMWFIYSDDDKTVPPEVYERPLIEKLRAAGASNLHVSVYEDVHDTSGTYFSGKDPYVYYGHWSWIYFLNNDCRDGDLTVWEWMAAQ